VLSDWERRRAGCPDIHFHDLRHQAISRFFDMGLTTPEVVSISGHRDIRISMQYSHPMRKRIIEQMDKGEVKRGSENEPPLRREDTIGVSEKSR
jgi:integrase